MPVHIERSGEYENILISTVEPPSSWEEFHGYVDELKQHLGTITARVDIINIPQATLPKGNPIPHLGRLSRFLEESREIGLYITVVPPTAYAIISTVTSLMRLTSFKLPKNEFAASLPEAYAMINHHRQVITRSDCDT